MHSYPCSAATSPINSTNADRKSSQLAERAYQGLTIVAMLLLLYSLGLFR
jgi:hypothetical protein